MISQLDLEGDVIVEDVVRRWMESEEMIESSNVGKVILIILPCESGTSQRKSHK